MTIYKLVKYNLEPRAIELKNQQKSNREIARILSKEAGMLVAKDSVNQYFKTHNKVLKQLAKKDVKFHKEMLRQHLEANEQLIYVSQEARAAIEEMKRDPNVPPWRRAGLIAVILHQAEVLLKRSGEISAAPQTNITVIKQEFNNFQQLVLSIIEEEGGDELSERILRRIQKETRQ